MSYEEKIKVIYEHYGMEKQIVKLYEEIGEVMIELSKYWLYNGNKAAIAEEIADVEMMFDQIVQALGIGKSVETMKNMKADRQIERIGG